MKITGPKLEQYRRNDKNGKKNFFELESDTLK